MVGSPLTWGLNSNLAGDTTHHRNRFRSLVLVVPRDVRNGNKRGGCQLPTVVELWLGLSVSGWVGNIQAKLVSSIMVGGCVCVCV